MIEAAEADARRELLAEIIAEASGIYCNCAARHRARAAENDAAVDAANLFETISKGFEGKP